MTRFQHLLAATVFLAGTSQAAAAVELFTPFTAAGDGSQIVCAIVNLEPTPIEISVTLRSAIGSDITNQTCPATLAPGAACLGVSRKAGPKTGYCHFSASSRKVRAGLFVLDDSFNVTSTLPATR